MTRPQTPLPANLPPSPPDTLNSKNLNEAQKTKHKRIIVVVVSTIILATLLTALLIMWLSRGSQPALSACTKAASDLEKEHALLQETVLDAQSTLQTDSSLLSEPELLDELNLKTQKAQKEVKPLQCDGSLKKEQIAANTSKMITQAEQLKTTAADLRTTILAVQGSQNFKSLEKVRSKLEDTTTQAESALRDAQDTEIDTSLRGALSAQIDDAKRLLEQLNRENKISDEKMSEFKKSMEAATDRLNEDLASVKQAIETKRDETAKKAAKEAARLAEQQRLETEHETGQQNQQTDNTDKWTTQQGVCSPGEQRIDSKGNIWSCVNEKDGAIKDFTFWSPAN